MKYTFLPSQAGWLGSLAISALLLSCSSVDTKRTESAAPTNESSIGAAQSAIMNTLENDALAAGKSLFQQNCTACHGANGKLGANGAHDLTKSNLTVTGRVYIVKNGLGKMPAFKSTLTDEEIEQVVTYSMTLR
ncbi:cytochrome c [Hymenobacter sp. GOD-10R]|uniref:c-type cytochrome n=1 Tax=Hymenobacter sp. GOD-10R TaxID=3093922 RepID=UPI002D79228F|nr:cytochrome c [Hymenobacter sp. GOD-10R]WRQ29168.1 cytochrome c [Hymenobacter sp. GOD-10R]